MKCKCGHEDWKHKGGSHGKRGGCTADRRIAPLVRNAVRYRDAEMIEPEKFGEIFKTLTPAAKARCIQRGRALVSCDCPYYHEIDIGQVAIIQPVEYKHEDGTRPQRDAVRNRRVSDDDNVHPVRDSKLLIKTN